MAEPIRCGVTFKPPSILMLYKAENGKVRKRSMNVSRWLPARSRDANPKDAVAGVLRSLRNHPRNAPYLRLLPEEQLERLVLLLLSHARGDDVKSVISSFREQRTDPHGELDLSPPKRHTDPLSFTSSDSHSPNSFTRPRGPDRHEKEIPDFDSDEDFEPRKRPSKPPAESLLAKTSSPSKLSRPTASDLQLESESESESDRSSPELDLPDESHPSARSPGNHLNDVDLNRVDEEELRHAKKQMDVVFEKNRVRPGDPDFVYDKQVEFETPDDAASWDEEDI